MMAFFALYVSSFWIWAGITIGVWVTLGGTAIIIAAVRGKA